MEVSSLDSFTLYIDELRWHLCKRIHTYNYLVFLQRRLWYLSGTNCLSIQSKEWQIVKGTDPHLIEYTNLLVRNTEQFLRIVYIMIDT